jgi:hypothetical protein
MLLRRSISTVAISALGLLASACPGKIDGDPVTPQESAACAL